MRDPFHKPVILFRDVAQISRLNGADLMAVVFECTDHVDRLDPGQVGATLVDHNAIRRAVCLDGLFKNPSRCGSGPAIGSHEVAVNPTGERLRPVFDIDVSLVNAP